MAELDETIRENAEGPAEAEVDGVRVRQHPLDDLIKTDQYLATKTARTANPALAFTRVRIVPPGAG